MPCTCCLPLKTESIDAYSKMVCSSTVLWGQTLVAPVGNASVSLCETLWLVRLHQL